MIHKDKGLVVYVDCQPSEQLDYHDDVSACFICLVCLEPEVFQEYLQYKDTPADLRPSVAEQIAENIRSIKHIYCIGSEAKYTHIETAGIKYLNHIIPQADSTIIKKYD